jgi:hypothetical protein
MTTFRAKSRALADGIVGIIDEVGPPMSVRQVFYQCVVRQLVANDKSAYVKIRRLLDLLRDSGDVDEEAIVDRSRSVREATTWTDADEFIEADPGSYRKDLWVMQPVRVEIWLEKDALVGVIEPVTRKLGVLLLPARGFASRSALYQASERINASEKLTIIYYLGDHDPSGLDMDRDLQHRLEKFGVTFSKPEMIEGPQATFDRLGILPEDIIEFNLPPQRVKSNAEAKKQGKKKGDPRATAFMKKYGADTVELDALPPDELRRRIKQAIKSHIKDAAWDRAQATEAAERESIAAYVAGWKKTRKLT